jgi:hypothetical protein
MAVAQQRRAMTASLASPIGGWNARDSLAEMNPLDAVQLTNFFPTPTDVTMRRGYSRYSLLTTSTGVVTISTITRSGTTATATTATAHNLTSGRYISITGCTPSDYNGIYMITVVNSTTFTYVMANVPANNATVVGTYTIGLLNEIQTLMNYAAPNVSNQKLFGIADGKIYDVTTNPATLVYSGLSNSQWQHINFSNAGGNFLVMVNGVDAAMVYDGTRWYKLATTATAQTILTLTSSGTTATVTTSVAHGLVTDNRVVISGATETPYNGTFRITVTGATTFTYTMASSTTSPATGTPVYTVLGIAGVNSNVFANVNSLQERIYFVEKNSLNFWYLPVNSLGGTATQFPLGSIARSGGFLQAMGTWTLDAGYGVDDLGAFVTSMGEVIVYKGTDPSDPNAWSLVGVWQMGQTFARRCFFKYAGDLLLLTQDGLVPMSASLQSSRLDPRVNLTDKIFYAVSQAADLYYNQFGWQINYFAPFNMLILNIPVTGGTEQFVMHTITKSWGRFTNIPANCWEVSGAEGMFFGSAGFVGKFYDGFSDAGNNIVANAQQAYSYFDSRGQLKRFTMVRPILQTDNTVPNVLCGISTDFDTVNLSNEITFNPSLAKVGIWDTSKWDDASWGAGLTVSKVWQGVTGIGYAGSVNISVASQGVDFHWASTDYVMERGGVL